MRRPPNHSFWPDDTSLFDDRRLDSKLLGTGQITDSHLLALAVAHDGALATFDRSLTANAVYHGAAALRLI